MSSAKLSTPSSFACRDKAVKVSMSILDRLMWARTSGFCVCLESEMGVMSLSSSALFRTRVELFLAK